MPAASKNRKKKQELCGLCGGPCAAGFTTSATDFGDALIVVRNVPALVCHQCGEAWLETAAVQALEDIVATARRRKVPIEIVTMAA